MNLQRVHLDYWRARKATPGWAWKAQTPKPPTLDVTIDRCVNAHALMRIDYVGLEVGNTLALLRMKMKRMSLMEAMVDLHAVTENQKRRALLVKWINRVMRNRRRKELSCTS